MCNSCFQRFIRSTTVGGLRDKARVYILCIHLKHETHTRARTHTHKGKKGITVL